MIDMKELEEMGKEWQDFTHVATTEKRHHPPDAGSAGNVRKEHLPHVQQALELPAGLRRSGRMPGKKSSRYREGIIVQTVGQLEDPMDGETMMETEAQHKGNIFMSLSKFSGKDGRACFRSEPDAVQNVKNAPIRMPHVSFPDQAFSSMEAYGMLVTQVCKANSLDYYYGPCTIAYTSCYLLE